jgi:hypothetical protein
MTTPSAMPGAAGPYPPDPTGTVFSDPVRPATTAPEEAADVADRAACDLGCDVNRARKLRGPHRQRWQGDH